MKPWERDWSGQNTAKETIKPWERNWDVDGAPQINAVDYNGTALLSTPGENSSPFKKMSLFMDKLFSFEVRDAAEKNKNNPRIQALEKAVGEDLSSVDWKEVGKSAVRETLNVGKTLTAEPFKIYGDWSRDKRDISKLSKEEAQKAKYNNFISDCYSKVGGYIEKIWDLGLNSEWLKEDERIFAENFVENPSLTRVLSLGAGAIPSILYGGAIAKITKSPSLAAIALSGADSSDIYWGAREAGESSNKALGLLAAGTAGTAAFEKYGLEQIFNNKIMPFSKRIVTSVLSEGLTEGTQTAYQNMVKKYGYDDTQALMEGVVESMIGGAIGGGTISTVYGGYVRLEQARNNLKEKGLTDSALDTIQEGFAEEIAKHRDTIEPMFQQNINKSLSTLEKFVAENEWTAEAQKALQTKQELEDVYTNVYDQLKAAGVEDNVANADAKIWQGIALWGSQESGLSPLEYMKQRMPKVESITYEQFQNKGKTLEEELNDYIPFQAMYRSKLPDFGSFYDDIVKNENTKDRYFTEDINGVGLDIPRNAIRHDANKHGLTKEEWQGIFDAVRNGGIKEARMGDYSKMHGVPVKLVVDVNGVEYGVTFEHMRNGRNLIQSVFVLDDKGWINEKQKKKSSQAEASEPLPKSRRLGNSMFDIISSLDGNVNNRGTFDPNNDNIYYQHGENRNIVKITGKEFGEYTGDDKAYITRAQQWYRDNLINNPVTSPVIGEVNFYNRQFSETKDKNYKNIQNLKYLPAVRQIIETSTNVVEEKPKHSRNDDIVKFYRITKPVSVNNMINSVSVVIAEDKRGNKYYTFEVKNENSLQNTSVERGNEGKETDNPVYNINIAPTRENVNKTLYQETEAPKGAYMQNLDRNGVIYLFEDADASTFMHETAHFFRKELEGFDTARSREMLQKMSEWENQEFDKRYKLKEENGRYVVTDKVGNVIYGAEKPFFDAETAREYARNEIFARGFEQYLREGKAPNNYLKQAFRSFWNWLRHLYKAAEELGVDINDSIRSVYGEIIGGKDLDFYLTAPVDEVLQQHFAENEERQKEYDKQIALAQAQPIKRGFFRNIAQERTESAKGRNEWWNKAVVPISTRAKRVNIKLRNKLRAYDYGVGAKLNQYYAQIKPFLDKWAKMTERDAVAFDLALKNSYVEKQLEIVNKYGAYDEFVRVKNLLNSLFDQATDVGIEMGYSADYFPRQIDDVEGFMSAMYGSPYASQLRRALKEADPDNVMTNEERAEFFNKYLRGFNRRDLNKPLPGNVKDRTIDIVTAEMNRYYKPSMQALINYIEGMNTSIESRKFWGFKSDDIDRSIGALTANMIDSGLIKPEQDAEVQEILRARFKARGVTNKYLLTLRNWAYMYTMGGINSAITQIDDISSSLYKAGLWNTVEAVFSRNRPGLSREELGLERIGQEFVEASTSSKAIRGVFKLTGLDKIDAFGKNTLINATFNKFQKMADNNEKELRARLEPVLEAETGQTIEDIKNGVISENVKLLMFNELADMQPISLSEMPEWYLTGGNGRVFYMLKTFLIKRLDIFRNECYDKYKQGNVKTSVQNLFRLSILMMMTGMSKDAIIDMLFGREFDLTDAVVNNFLGLFGLSKYSLYQARYEGPKAFLEAFLIPPIYPMAEDLFSDVYKSLFSKKGKDISDYEIWKGFPLVGRFYYWWGGGGRTKLEKKNKKKLK